jgi:glycosyltransferase involved in cell wall biosynthesis
LSNGGAITIVIASRCDDARSDLLQRACDSVRAMAGGHAYSILVVANGRLVSQAVLDRLASRADTKVVRLTSGSHPLARRVGAELAEGEFLGFLDDDDELLPDTLGRKLAYFREHAGVDVLVSDGLHVTGEAVRTIFPPKAERCDDFIDTMMQVGWSACSFTLRREKIDLAVFDPELRHLEWTLMALRLARHHEIGFLDEPMYRYYNDTPGSLSKSAAHALAAPEIWRRLLGEYAGTRYETAMRRRLGSECHNASWEHARQGNLREAWRLHLRSLRAPGGLWSYLPYSRKLLPGSRP